MARQIPFIFRRGNTIFFRLAVPRQLRPIIGLREITKSLKTQDRNIAAPIALRLAASVKQRFLQLAQDMATDKDIQVNFGFEIDLDELGIPKRIKVNAEPSEIDAVNSAVSNALESLKQSGSIIPQSSQRIVPQARKSGSTPTLKNVIDKFLDRYPKSNRSAMYKKHVLVLGMLLEVVGNKPIPELRQGDINKFFDLIVNLPPRWKDACRKNGCTVQQLAEMDHPETLGQKTFEDTYIASIRPFLVAAKRDWQDEGFPLGLTTDGIEYEGEEAGANKQRAFNHPELVRLFEGDEMRAFAANKEQAHRFWLPHIGLFTGARVNEICQINPQVDIQQTTDGIWYFHITQDSEADSRIVKSVKTGESRKVPIHKQLIELGFIDYAARVKASGAKLLFPEWKPVNKRASGNAEDWFRDFLVKTDLRDETPRAKILGMHAFRHTLLTHGAIQKLKLTDITGHAQNPVGATGAAQGYFDPALLDPLREHKTLLDQLDYKISFHHPDTPINARKRALTD